ncbi:MAG: flagellar hook-associated protein FlgK [Actinomycetota bacterium]|jgi:flagellar hook-associated protein 1 FlgK|nr:flagellar hook-associated protein FlgK [Actinomycetota bacterium]
MSNLGIDIAGSALAAQQSAMDAVAQNLANANTPGYVAETAVLSVNPAAAGGGVGAGVRVTGITQPADQLAQVANQQAQGALSQATALQQVLSQAQDAFPTGSGTGISSQLANFWSAWDNINQNPSSAAPYTQVTDLAQGLATSLHEASTQLTQAQTNTQQQLTDAVTNANSLLGQVANLNSQILQVAGAGGSTNQLVDQQDHLVDQLASALGATTTTSANGTVNVMVGGTALVQGTTADQLTTQTDPTTGATAVQALAGSGSASASVPLTVTSGTAAGLLAALNTYLPGYQSRLDTVAQALASTVDTQLAAGYTTSGSAGDPLFTVSGSDGTSATTTGVTAANITVNPTVVASPQTTLAVSNTSSMPAASNNGANAQAIADLGSSTTGPDLAFTNFIQKIGTDVQSANSQVSAQTSVVNAASQHLQEIGGVNTNEQMVSMLNYQQAYQAAAQVVSSINLAVQSLLSAI